MPVEQFDGRSLSDRPPRVGSRGDTPAVQDRGTAKGRPSLAQTASGTEKLRTDNRTLEAGNTRPTSSSGAGPKPPQKFSDALV